jgi:hypothetical protein
MSVTDHRVTSMRTAEIRVVFTHVRANKDFMGMDISTVQVDVLLTPWAN